MTPDHVRFTFLIDPAKLKVNLEADVILHQTYTYFVVSNFRMPGHANGAVLPDIEIRKKDGIWVHIDSGKETDLSRAVGQAIEVKMPEVQLKEFPVDTIEDSEAF